MDSSAGHVESVFEVLCTTVMGVERQPLRLKSVWLNVVLMGLTCSRGLGIGTKYISVFALLRVLVTLYT
jgi:hypothetical protein